MSIFDPLERRQAPDQWNDIERRARLGQPLAGARSSSHARFAVMAVAAALAVGVIGMATAGRDSELESSSTAGPPVTADEFDLPFCQGWAPKTLRTLGISSTVTVNEEGAILTLQNATDERYLVSDGRVLAPLSEEGAVIANASTSLVYLPPEPIEAGGSLILGYAGRAQVATTDCTAESAVERPPIADGVYPFVYLVTIGDDVYASDSIELRVSNGETEPVGG